MRTMTNPVEFCRILAQSKTFLQITNNFAMRQFISSYGFRATRELAEKVMQIRAEQIQ